jgi:FixJ family two-component response regulator
VFGSQKLKFDPIEFPRGVRLAPRREFVQDRPDRTVRPSRVSTMEDVSTVHVVEDDEAFRSALVRLLRVSGYDVRAHASAGEFLDAAPSGPGCVLLDLHLPDLGGLELQQELARRRVTLPIVFLTGQGSVRASVHAMQAGAEDFLTKPVEQPELLAAIERALARDRAERAETSRLEDLRARYEKLTPAEREVMARVASGHLNKQIAHQFGRTERTIKGHRALVMEKMQAQSTADLVRMAGLLGIPVRPPDA